MLEFVGENKKLKVLEVSDCPSELIKRLPSGSRCLKRIRLSLLCCPTGMKLNLDLCQLPKLYELKLYCNRELDNFPFLGNLKHLYLLGVKNLDLQPLDAMEIATSCRLESLGLGDCQFLANSFVHFVQRLPALKSLHLEQCREWQPLVVLEGLSKCARLKTLELLDFNINEEFPMGLKLCTNLTELTVIPNAHRFEMSAFNERLFKGTCALKSTLKKFTWGFSRKYMDHFFTTCNTVDQVPFIDEGHLNPFVMISLKDLQNRLLDEMKSTQISVTTSITSGDVFGIRP